ncbi:MAG: DoxX family protein [Chryseolinea sp.]
MKNVIIETSEDWTGLILRLTAALIMLPHGLQKLLGVFGGFGYTKTMNYFTGTMKLPWIVSFLVIIIECVAPVGLIAGFITRFWALLLLFVMMGAILTTAGRHGFFMNWNGGQQGEGYEYHLLFIAICLSIIIIGGGRYSVDARL